MKQLWVKSKLFLLLLNFSDLLELKHLSCTRY